MQRIILLYESGQEVEIEIEADKLERWLADGAATIRRYRAGRPVVSLS